MKRTKLRRKSKSPIRKIQDQLWKECRRISYDLYKAQNGSIRCFTCDKEIEGSNRQLGHFIPKASIGAYLKYDLRVLRWQCYYCNINLGGNGATFYKRLVEEKGQEYVDQIFKDKQITVKAIDKYTELLALYEEM